MSCWIVYQDGYEDGRRMRHVFSRHAERAEATAAARELSIMLGFPIETRRLDSIAEVLAFEIDPNPTDDGWAKTEEALARAEFDQAVRPPGAL